MSVLIKKLSGRNMRNCNAKKHKISFWHLNDAAAPALMISYALGRVGCQISGDGDWGINNLKPKPFSWLPDWMWAYDYPNNINNEGIEIENSIFPDYNHKLENPVYPTPIYEMFMCFGLFAFIWREIKRLYCNVSGDSNSRSYSGYYMVRL